VSTTTVKAWAYLSGATLLPLRETRMLPWPAIPPESIITYSQFPIFRTRKEGRQWGRAHRLTLCNLTRVQIKLPCSRPTPAKH
jgi:hypothetical protein